MFRIPNKAAYLLGLYLILLIGVRFGTELLIRTFVLSLGFGDTEVKAFIFDNEMNLQAFCLAATLGVAAWSLRQPWFNAGQIRDEGRKLFVFARLSDLSHIFSESFFKGFLVASLGVGFSVFLGYSVLEVPAFSEVAWFKLLPSFIVQGFLLLMWIVLIDFQRYFLFKAWVETSDKKSNSATFFSEALVSRLCIIIFEALFYFWVLNSSYFWLDRLYIALLCLLMAAGKLLWFEFSLRKSAVGVLSLALRRIFCLFSFAFTLIHIFGISVGGYKRVSWMSSFPGPLREPTGNLAVGSPAGQILFALLLVVCVNVLIRRSLKSDPSR